MSPEVDIFWAVVIGSVALVTLSSSIIIFVIISQRKIISLQNKQLEQTQRSEQRYSDLFNNVNDIVYVLSLEGVILQANITTTRLLGFRLEEVLGKAIENYIHPKYNLGVEQCLRKTRYEGESRGHIPIVGKNGIVLVFEYNNSVIFEGNHATAIRGIARNITEQQQLQEMLRENEGNFRHLVKFLPVATAVYCEEKICYVNDATVKLFKATSEEQLLQIPFLELLEKDFRNNSVERMKNVVEQKIDIPPTQCLILQLDGNKKTIEFSAVPILFAQKKSAQIIFYDINNETSY